MNKLPNEKLAHMESGMTYLQQEMKDLKVEHKEAYKNLNSTLEQLSAAVVRLTTATELNKGIVEKVSVIETRQQNITEDVKDLCRRTEHIEVKVWYAVGFAAAVAIALPRLLTYLA